MAFIHFLLRAGTTILLVLVTFTLAVIIGVSGAAFLVYGYATGASRLHPGPVNTLIQPLLLMPVICVASVLLGAILGSRFLSRGASQRTGKGGMAFMDNDKPVVSNDPGELKADRDKYHRQYLAAKNAAIQMQGQAESSERARAAAVADVNQLRANTVAKDLYEKLRQQFEDLTARFDRSQIQARNEQQELRRLTQENARLASDLNNLKWQLSKSQEQVQALMRQDATRQLENERLRDRLLQLQQGGAVTTARAEFEEPQAGDPPTYEQEKGQHNHRKVAPEAGTSFQLADSWRLIGASRRGRGHEYKHVFRDDDFETRLFADNRGVVVAIADGLGSKPFSRWGARAAVLGAVNAPQESRLKQLADDVATLAQPTSKYPMSEGQLNELAQRRDRDARGLVHDMLVGARTKVSDISHQRGKPYEDLHTTLLVYIAIPYGAGSMYIASAQVGDGALRSRSQTLDGPHWSLEEQPQLNGVDNEVMPFMRMQPDRYDDLIHVYNLEALSFVVGMTDGTLDDIEGGPDENGLFKNIEDFYQRICKESLANAQPAAGLFDFLGYRRRASFDDRTLVCLYRQP